MPSKCYQQRNLLPFKNWHYPTIAISSSLLLLPNQIQIHLPNSERSSSTDPALWWRKLQCLLQDTKQGERAANAQKIWTPHWLSGKVFFFFFFGLTAHGMWEFPDQGKNRTPCSAKSFNYWTSRETQAKICKGNIKAEGHRVPAQLVDFLLFPWW